MHRYIEYFTASTYWRGHDVSAGTDAWDTICGGAKLSELEEICNTAVEKLEAIRNYQERIEEMEKDRDVLLESYALRAPKALDELTPEERHHVYRMLRLRAAIRIGGTIEVSGMFGVGSEFCHPEVRSSTQ